MTLVLGLAVVSAAVGCCSDSGTSLETATVSDVAAAPSAAIVFTPDPSLVDEVQADLARWSAATGLDLQVGPNGVVVQQTADHYTNPADGKTAYGRTGVVDGRLTIQVAADRCAAFGSRCAVVLLHEIGHVIQGQNLNQHVTDDPHAVMTRTAAGDLITAADLVYVCESRPCTVFQPETSE